MILWFAYAMLVTTVLATAATALEPLLREYGRPSRWLWLGVVTGGLLALLLVPAAALRQGAAASTAAPMEALAGSLDGVGAEPLAGARAASGGGRVTDPAGATGITDDAALSIVRPASLRRASSALALLARRIDRPLALVWLVLSGVVLVSMARSARRIATLRRSGRLRTLGGVSLLAGASRGPAATGIVRPLIILPAWITELRRSHRRYLVAHEVEHLRARDPLLKLLGATALALMPWNVPLWWVLRRLQLAIEIDCDARVVARYDARREYATLLLDVAGRPRRRPVLALGAVNGPGFLERRVIAMTQHRNTSTTRRSAQATVAAVFIALVFMIERPPLPVLAQTAPALLAAPAAQQPHAQPAPAHQTPAAQRPVPAHQPPATQQPEPANQPPAAHTPTALQQATVSQRGTIAGEIRDRAGAPVAAAQISLPGLGVGALTNAQGRFIVPNVSAGSHLLRVVARGFSSQEVEAVRVEAGRTTWVELTARGVGEPEVPAVQRIRPETDVPAPAVGPGRSAPLTPPVAPTTPPMAPATPPVAPPTPPMPPATPSRAPATPSRAPATPSTTPPTEPSNPVPVAPSSPATAPAPPVRAEPLPSASAAPLPPPTPSPVPLGAPSPSPPIPPVAPPRGTAEAVATLVGAVVDSAGAPIPDAQVSVRGTQRGALTNRDGRFLLLNVATGRQTLRVTAPGYRTHDVESVVAAGTSLRIVLRPDE